MAVFSTNQVRQLYVVDNVASSESALATAGDIFAKKSGDDIYFKYVGALGDTMRTDIVNQKQLIYTSVATSDKLAYKLKGQKITLNPNVNGGEPLEGRDYLLRVLFSEYIGISPVDKTLKYGTVHITPGMTASDFYAEMAYSLMQSQKKEPNPIMNVAVIVSGTFEGNEISDTDTLQDVKDMGTIEGIVIYEAGQPWHLGVMPQGVIKIDAQVTKITYNGDDSVFWGVVGDVPMPSSYVLPEGQKIADLEYFCMGERGDVYRNVGWPNAIPTKYLVDETKEYDVLDIHYYYEGAGENPQKSEKDLTIVAEASVMESLVTKLQSVSGLTVTTVS